MCNNCCENLLRGCGLKASKIVYVFTTILLIMSLLVAGMTGYDLFGNGNVLNGMPDFMLTGSFVLCLLLVIVCIVGLVGTCYQARDTELNHDGRGRVTADDFDVGRCRGAFNCFIVFLVIFFGCHVAFGAFALDYGGELADDGTTSASTASSQSWVTEEYIKHLDGLMKDAASDAGATASQPGDFSKGGADWIKTQDYFECCGFVSWMPWHMTGKFCTYPAIVSTGGACTAETCPAANKCTASTGNTNGCNAATVGDLKWYNGTFIDKAANGPCSDSFGKLFKDLGIYIIVLAGVELIVILAAFALCCTARVGRDVPKHMRHHDSPRGVNRQGIHMMRP